MNYLITLSQQCYTCIMETIKFVYILHTTQPTDGIFPEFVGIGIVMLFQK